MNVTKLLLLGVLSASAILFTACAPANIQAQIRNSDVNSNMMTRCEEVDMRSTSDMTKLFQKYDGWRMIYISEYTTGNKIGTSGSVCFEKPKN
ncbi:hypothetical protein [Sulfuricurvum sp.]|uniref:hypothetical protein n=1 Tax=Sulfuricurvum sp. TaxID=2025608 RepID=UPI0025DE46FA|nr:hypothetical protein [Sulfuricurvum sp.]